MMVAEGRQGLHRVWMIGAVLDCMSIGRCCGVGLAWSEVELSGKLSKFSGGPPGPHEAAKGFPQLDGVEIGADFLEVGRRGWPHGCECRGFCVHV